MGLYRCTAFAVAMLFVLPLQAKEVGWGTTKTNKVFRWERSETDVDHTFFVPGSMKQVSVGGDGAVWGVSPSGDVKRWDGSQWQPVSGNLLQVSVGNAGEVWGITAAANDVVRWNGSTQNWDVQRKCDGMGQPQPCMASISIGVDGTKVLISKTGDVYRLDGLGLTQMTGRRLTRVAVTDSQRILGVDADGEVFRWAGAQSRWESTGLGVPPTDVCSGFDEPGPDGKCPHPRIPYQDAVETQTGTVWTIFPHLPNGRINQIFAQLANGSTMNLGLNLQIQNEEASQIAVRDPVPASPTPSPTPPSAQLTDEQQQVLDAQNNERKSLGISPLTWSPGLAQYAQQRADFLAAQNDIWLTHLDDRGKSSNTFKPGEEIGENLYQSSNWSSSGPGKTAPLSEAVLGVHNVPGLKDLPGWLDEKPWYHYDDNTCDPGRKCGHYTQMVWKASQLVGCAKRTSTFNGWLYTYIACEYYPAGNIGGKPY